MDGADLSFEQHGAIRHDRAALPILAELEDILACVAADRAGVRLHGLAGLAAVLNAETPIGGVAAARLGSAARPVRAVLFNKTLGKNWALGWHQDRTVAVRMRHDRPGWGPWSIKERVSYVEPPTATLEAMVTVRVHLDPVPPDNAPLLIAPGSHKLGRIPERAIGDTVDRCGVATCLADRGDVWLYATLIVHASGPSIGHAQRRVLQIDYSASDLPSPLQWLGL